MDTNCAKGRRASSSSASAPEDPARTADRGETSGSEKRSDRRKVLQGVVGLAAVGVAGGSVLSGASSSPAGAATTTEPGAVAPAVVALTDAPTIAVNASLGNDFRVTINGNRTMGNPSNPVNGQQILFQITQGAGGSFTITWSSAYDFSGGLPQPTLSTGAGQTDLLGFIYNAAKSSWLLAAYLNGFS